MKTSVAALVTAAERFVRRFPRHRGCVALLFTSDEEGAGVDGTAAVVDELERRKIIIDASILGEPTSSALLGDAMKNGRRGSLNGVLRVKGVQCHIAYPEQGRNPIHMAMPALAELAATRWDRGNEYFSPTSFQMSYVQAGAGANNTIPGTMDVLFNFRFSTETSADDLKSRVEAILKTHDLDYDLTWTLSAAPFLSPRGPLVDMVSAAVATVTGVTPAVWTSGGTSDGRFLARISREVVEFGPINKSIHAIDEHVRIADIDPLSAIYEKSLESLLAN
jgi:succinyl-diaminopimelate desuccinylase